jgi:hypothetical protein
MSFITVKEKMVECAFIEHYVKQNIYWSREGHLSKISCTQYLGEHISDSHICMD